jgi:AcrR family transcriptional regulator
MADQELRSPEKERQILDGAAAAFSRDGYEGASMSGIAAAAGVSKGTLYNYFNGKKALFTAFVQRECTEKLLLIFDELDGEAPIQATLLRVGRRIMDMLLSDTGLAIYRMVVAEARKFPELAEAFRGRTAVRAGAEQGNHAAAHGVGLDRDGGGDRPRGAGGGQAVSARLRAEVTRLRQAG